MRNNCIVRAMAVVSRCRHPLSCGHGVKISFSLSIHFFLKPLPRDQVGLKSGVDRTYNSFHAAFNAFKQHFTDFGSVVKSRT